MPKIVHIFVATLLACGCNGESFEPEIPVECTTWVMGFCESVPNYPNEQVEKVLTNLGDKMNSFQIDDDVDPGRLGDDTSIAVELCGVSEQKLIFPQAGQDKNNKWYTVINRKDRPLQGYRVEMCNTRGSCGSVVTIQEGYKGECVQKYVYRLVNVLDTDGSYVQRPLKLPSCCSCVASLL